MRVCHLDTCPVGIATQNPVLRERFTGKPEFVENFFLFLAEEVRGYLAELGFRTHRRGDRARRGARRARRRCDHWKAAGLDLAPVLFVPELPEGAARRGIVAQDHGLDKALDNELHRAGRAGAGRRHAGARRARGPQRAPQRRRDARRRGRPAATAATACPTTPSTFTLRGTGGQSFGAFLPRGVTLRLIGDANDYVAKGLSGGRVIVRPAETAPFVGAEEQRSSRATPSCTGRPPARCSCAAGPGSGSRSATPAPPRWSRASATTAAST